MTTDIDTYDGLQAAVADWLNRADLVDTIPSFIRLAEAQFNRELRTRDMMVRATTTSDLEFIQLPDDFLQEYTLTLDTTNQAPQNELRYVGKNTADRMKSEQLPGPPGYYTTFSNTFELIPTPTTDTILQLVYYAQIPRLGELVGVPPDPVVPRTSNWLLAKSPDLYLASSILQAAPYINDTERLQTWAALRAQIMTGMGLEDERAMRSSTQVTARVRAF